MPGSSTTPGRPSACVGALGHIAFHYTDSVGTRRQFSIAAQWLACTFPCRRFADILTDAGARLGADVVRYTFIVVDLHHLLLAGLPAHLCKNAAAPKRSRIRSIRSQLRTQRFSSLSSFVWLEKYHSRDLSNFCVFTQGLGDKQKLALSVD